MAPEYAMHRYLSVKADVFSFGILSWRLLVVDSKPESESLRNASKKRDVVGMDSVPKDDTY
ncbi:putative protein kinase RLK-Pelle-DLSV family [Helianthus annuus]|nr:putative protein kinase RLK-Pelle-DLSV family [Helianthus annuus]